MQNIGKLEGIQLEVKNDTTQNHVGDLELCRKGIDLLIDAFNILGNSESSVDKEGAYRLVIWGYLETITSTIVWGLDAICKGQYRIGMILVRVLIEEVITSKYFYQHPEKAFETLKQASEESTSRVRFEPSIYKRFKAVGLGPHDSLYEFYGQISERFSHPTTTMLPLTVDENRLMKIDEPVYKAEYFTTMSKYLIRLAYIMGDVVNKTYPEIAKNSPDWANQVKKFCSSVDEIENRDI